MSGSCVEATPEVNNSQSLRSFDRPWTDIRWYSCADSMVLSQITVAELNRKEFNRNKIYSGVHVIKYTFIAEYTNIQYEPILKTQEFYFFVMK